jgi:hypothetical protein
MDSSRFLRRRSALAAWLAVPLMLALVAEFGASGFREFQQIAAVRSMALETLIPQMEAETRLFEQFCTGFMASSTAGNPVEDALIGQINEAARLSGCMVTSVKVEMVPVDAALNINRISISLRGTGSAREINNFLKNIKNKDSRIYEERILLISSMDDPDMFEIEAELGKVCIGH